MSSTMAGMLTGSACARAASRNPTISSIVSPLARSATRNAANWAGVASPAMTCSMAQVDSAIDRSCRSSRRVSRAGQVGMADMGEG